MASPTNKHDKHNTGATPHRPYGHQAGKWEVVRELLFLLTFCIIMTALAFAFNRSNIGKEFSAFVYRVLDGGFAGPDEPRRVTLVDIGNLRPNAETGVTPRGQLKALLEAIALYDPAAIGVDIDFAPESAATDLPFVTKDDPLKFVTKDDPSFFTSCLNLHDRVTKPIPVFLGIFRTQFLPLDRWLGFPAFARLAAALVVPGNTPAEAVWSVPGGEANSEAKTALNGQNHPPPPDRKTMSVALAYEVSVKDPRSFQGFFQRLRRVELTRDVSLNLFHINYGLRQRLMETAIVVDKQDFKSAAALQTRLRPKANDLTGHAVLIGDVHNAEETDVFSDPASNRRPIPGVVVHACATSTLISSPIYYFPEIDDFVLDLIVSFPISAIAIMIFHSKLFHGLNHDRLLVFCNFALATLIFVFGCILNRSGVRWPDFLLLSIGLYLHPTIHRKAEFLVRHLAHWLKAPEVQK